MQWGDIGIISQQRSAPRSYMSHELDCPRLPWTPFISKVVWRGGSADDYMQMCAQVTAYHATPSRCAFSKRALVAQGLVQIAP